MLLNGASGSAIGPTPCNAAHYCPRASKDVHQSRPATRYPCTTSLSTSSIECQRGSAATVTTAVGRTAGPPECRHARTLLANGGGRWASTTPYNLHPPFIAQPGLLFLFLTTQHYCPTPQQAPSSSDILPNFASQSCPTFFSFSQQQRRPRGSQGFACCATTSSSSGNLSWLELAHKTASKSIYRITKGQPALQETMTVALMSHSANMPGYKHTTDLDEVSRYCFLALLSCSVSDNHVLRKIMSFLFCLTCLATPGSLDTSLGQISGLKDPFSHKWTLNHTRQFYHGHNQETCPSRALSTMNLENSNHHGYVPLVSISQTH